MEVKRIRSKVVMLPTGKEMNIGTDKHWFTGRHLILNEIEQHLYFTTDEEIKEGDWYINSRNKPYLNRAGNTNFEGLYDKCKKIVATTDTSLLLYVGENYTRTIIRKEGKNYQTFPQPTQAFIKKYVELGGIDEVDLEYEEFRAMLGLDIDDNTKINYSDPWYELKVDSHNTITIHAIKDSWSREEFEQHILNIYRDIYPNKNWQSKAWDYINENL